MHHIPQVYVLLWRCFFFFNDTATTEIYTLSLHDALPISGRVFGGDGGAAFRRATQPRKRSLRGRHCREVRCEARRYPGRLARLPGEAAQDAGRGRARRRKVRGRLEGDQPCCGSGSAYEFRRAGSTYPRGIREGDRLLRSIAVPRALPLRYMPGRGWGQHLWVSQEKRGEARDSPRCGSRCGGGGGTRGYPSRGRSVALAWMC